jgi:hypothetical protein
MAPLRPPLREGSGFWLDERDSIPGRQTRLASVSTQPYTQRVHVAVSPGEKCLEREAESSRPYECVSKSFRTGRPERELQMVKFCATRYSFIAILWVSLVSFAAITLCVASQRAIPKVSVYFVVESVRKLLNTTSYSAGIKNACSFIPVSPHGVDRHRGNFTLRLPYNTREKWKHNRKVVFLCIFVPMFRLPNQSTDLY